jgi:hypothetical protein
LLKISIFNFILYYTINHAIIAIDGYSKQNSSNKIA